MLQIKITKKFNIKSLNNQKTQHLNFYFQRHKIYLQAFD